MKDAKEKLSDQPADDLSKLETQENGVSKTAVLILRCSKGDAKAADELIKIFRPMINNYFKKLTKNEDDAEDLTQITFVKAIRSLKSLRNPNHFRAWLFRIAINAWMEKGRRLQPECHVSETKFPVMRNKFGRPESEVIKNDFKERMLKSISYLPEEQQIAIMLKSFQQLSNQEISEIMDVNPNTVRWYIHQARKSLSENLSGSERRKAFPKSMENENEI